ILPCFNTEIVFASGSSRGNSADAVHSLWADRVAAQSVKPRYLRISCTLSVKSFRTAASKILQFNDESISGGPAAICRTGVNHARLSATDWEAANGGRGNQGVTMTSMTTLPVAGSKSLDLAVRELSRDVTPATAPDAKGDRERIAAIKQSVDIADTT